MSDVSKTLDAIEETLDNIDVIKSRMFFAGVTVGASLGLAVGGVWWLVAKKRLELKYEQIADAEIAEAKAFYSRLHKTGDLATPEGAAAVLLPENNLEMAAKALTEYQRGRQELLKEEADDDEVETVTETNVFEEHASQFMFDLEEEIKRRSPDRPYVVSEEEWTEGQNEWQQVTLTYYAGDATLSDEKDEHIPDVEAVIGSANLDRFGHGCADANTVFIRNEKMGIQFEVVRSDGKYSHEVLGLQHSDETFARRSRRVRMDDD